MKFTVSAALLFAVAAQANGPPPQRDNYGGGPPSNGGRPPSNGGRPPYNGGGSARPPPPFGIDLAKIAGEATRTGTCFVNRFYRDAQTIECGKNGGENLVGCICGNQEHISEGINKILGTCIDPNTFLNRIFEKIGGGIGSIAINGLCGAYNSEGHYNGGDGGRGDGGRGDGGRGDGGRGDGGRGDGGRGDGGRGGGGGGDYPPEGDY